MTIRQYAAFHLRYRPGHFNLIPKSCRLPQKYLVDTRVKAETDPLCYVRDHQDGFNGFRAETVHGVRDVLADGEEQGRAVGRRVVLPGSVTGSPRYMMSKLQGFFITDTCITQTDRPGQKRNHRRFACAISGTWTGQRTTQTSSVRFSI